MENQPEYGIKKEMVEVENFYHYRTLTTTFNKYDKENMVISLCSGLISEIGEVNGKLNKCLRDDKGIITDLRKTEVLYEIGDCFWYLSELANWFNITFIAEYFIKSTETIFKESIKLINFVDPLVNESIYGFNEYLQDTDFERVFYQLKLISDKLNIPVLTVLQMNINKLTDRFNRNKINGQGDNR